MTRYLALLFRFRRAVLFVLTTLSLAACLGLFSLSVTSDTRVFFAADNPHLIQLQHFERTYSENNNVLFVISSDEGSLITAEHLSALQDFTARAWQLPHSTRVDSLTNFPHIETLDDDVYIGDLVEGPGPWDESELERFERVAQTDPQLSGRLISRDLTTAGVNVNFNLPASGSDVINDVNTAAVKLAEAFEDHYPSLEVHVTGNVVLMQAFSLAAMRDIQMLVPLSLLVILVVLIITLRSIRQTMALAGILALSAAIATSILGWASMPLDIATVVAPVIIMTLALASSVHVVTAIHRSLRQGHERQTAIELGLKENFHPIVMTSLTTAIGFVSLNLAEAPPFKVLGNLVVVGILINFIFTFTLLPLLFSQLPLKPGRSALPLQSTRLVNLIQFNRWPVTVVGLILIVSATMGIFKITLDDDFIRYFDESFAYRAASDITEERLTGLNIVEFDLDTNQEDGVFDPVYQSQVSAFADWLRAQQGIASVTAITDLTKKLHRNLDPEGTATLPIPQSREQIAQYYLLLDMSLPEGRSLSDVISTDQSSSRVTAILRNATSGDIRRMNNRATDWLSDNAPSLVTSGISINVLFSHLSINNIRSMITGTAISFAAISLVIALLMRSVTLGTISLFANSIPALVGFGLWGLLVGTVNLGASVLVAMTLGIVVDDTIHFLNAYRNRRLEGNKSGPAAADALLTVGPAMIITTVSLIAGFGVLALSGFDVNRTLGTFTAIIIAVALAADLLLLPAILTLREKKASL